MQAMNKLARLCELPISEDDFPKRRCGNASIFRLHGGMNGPAADLRCATSIIGAPPSRRTERFAYKH